MHDRQASVDRRKKLIRRRSNALALAWLIALGLIAVACGGKSKQSTTNSQAPAPLATSVPASSGNFPSNNASAIRVVAAENFYGDIAHQLGGSQVNVVSLLSNPNADPHEYESNTAAAKAVAGAQLVIENGLGYDAFMDKLLAASPNQNRIVINAGDLAGRKLGDNPHIWYNPSWMSRVADRVSATLQQLEPGNTQQFATRNQQFKASLTPLTEEMAAIKAKDGGAHLTQSEAVFGYMGKALGLQIDDGAFQHAIEEGTDPSAQAVAQIEGELKQHQVKALLYNTQATEPITTNLEHLASQEHIPVVGVSETEPPGMTYQQWMLRQLDSLQKALGG